MTSDGMTTVEQGPIDGSSIGASRTAGTIPNAAAANGAPAVIVAPATGASPSVTADLGELMRSRRAVRKFASLSVPERDVREVLEAARWAPSPANLQPARFIWVRDVVRKRELQALAAESKELSA